MLLAFSITPLGTGRSDDSVHEAVAAAVQVVRESGLPNKTSSSFTEVEGSWDEVFEVVRRATDAVAEYGSRVSIVMKADIRPGHEDMLEGKVERLERTLRSSSQP